MGVLLFHYVGSENGTQVVKLDTFTHFGPQHITSKAIYTWKKFEYKKILGEVEHGGVAHL